MHIDSSLAHGLAKRDLRRITHRALQAECAINRLSERWTHGCYRRKAAVRRAIGDVDKLLGSAAWARRSYERRKGGYAAWLVPDEAGDGVLIAQRLALVCSAGLMFPLTRREPVLAMDLHAIARGHQRLSEFAWTELHRELRTAVILAPVIAGIARRAAWRQFALPAGDGLLVGEVGAAGELTARTLIVDLSPRWAAVKARFDGTLAAGKGELTLDAAGVDRALDLRSDSASQWFDLWRNRLSGPAFEFLRERYAPGRDFAALEWARGRA